jgi:hypothetical protein
MDGSDPTYGYMSRFYTILPTIPPINAAAQSWPILLATCIHYQYNSIVAMEIEDLQLSTHYLCIGYCGFVVRLLQINCWLRNR